MRLENDIAYNSRYQSEKIRICKID